MRPVSFLFRILTSRKPRQMRNDIWQYPGIDFDNISQYATFYQNIPHGSRDGSKPLPMTHDIWQSNGLDLININLFAKFHKKIFQLKR